MCAGQSGQANHGEPAKFNAQGEAVVDPALVHGKRAGFHAGLYIPGNPARFPEIKRIPAWESKCLRGPPQSTTLTSGGYNTFL